jgi:hypothetical protein
VNLFERCRDTPVSSHVAEADMKTASSLIRLLALAACFAVYVAAAGEIHLTGMRRAMQTMAGPGGQSTVLELAMVEGGDAEGSFLRPPA